MTRPAAITVTPADPKEFVRYGYRGSCLGLEDPRRAWHRLAEKIKAMAGYSYREEQRSGGG
ncbi:MAG: hypothetical protein H5T97_00940 [Firmicutes bacterium]|nr:hypothetical protein [Bacillota bacterium]